MRKYLKKRGFTDRLYVYNLCFTWAYTMLCVVLSVFGGKLGIEDYSFVSIVTPLVWTEQAVHTGYVIWKAKCENMQKHNPEGIIM